MLTSTRATEHRASAQPVRARSGHLQRSLLQEIARHVSGGGVVVFPTETVYGVGTSAFSSAGIRRIYQLKGRSWTKPLALLVPSLKAAGPLVEEIPPEAFRLSEAFWPGPLTLIFKASPLGKLVTGGLQTIGVRVPRHPIALALLEMVGVPMATTSVNRSGENPATSGHRARQVFGADVEWLIDGGVCAVKKASSVVDLSSYPFTVKRHGAIHKAVLEKTLFKSE
jgi:L-threonylcarbamoyladenylate synthase